MTLRKEGKQSVAILAHVLRLCCGARRLRAWLSQASGDPPRGGMAPARGISARHGASVAHTSGAAEAAELMLRLGGRGRSEAVEASDELGALVLAILDSSVAVSSVLGAEYHGKGAGGRGQSHAGKRYCRGCRRWLEQACFGAKDALCLPDKRAMDNITKLARKQGRSR